MNEGRPIAAWLLASRTSQINPATKRPWSQDYFLARLEEETGWTPFRSNYSKYENGKLTPRPETLARFVDFWARHGIEGPDLTSPEPPVTESVDQVAAAIREQTKAMVASQAQIAAAILEQTQMLREAIQSGIVPGLLDWAEVQRQRLEAEATPPQRPKSNNRPEPARRP